MRLYYYYSYSFADAISPELISRICSKRISTINGYEKKRGGSTHLLALGSIFHHARNGDIIWGTGINPYWQEKTPPLRKLDIKAVRGPLTRDYITDKLGLDCPEIYGDPALLFPKYFPEFDVSTVNDYTVIAQHNDEEFVLKNWSKFEKYNIFLCQRTNRLPWRKVINKITASRFIISSSLHALIFQL